MVRVYSTPTYEGTWRVEGSSGFRDSSKKDPFDEKAWRHWVRERNLGKLQTEHGLADLLLGGKTSVCFKSQEEMENALSYRHHGGLVRYHRQAIVRGEVSRELKDMLKSLGFEIHKPR